MTRTYLLMFTFVLIFAGCSGGSSDPIAGVKTPGSIDNIPIIDLSQAGGVTQATGLLGAYEITINPENMTAELVSKRMGAIGDSYIVSGAAFFTILPCADCLRIVGVGLDADGNGWLKFEISHPFAPGNPGLPPSASNRNDLDVFDLAMVIHPSGVTPQTFTKTGKSAYSTSCVGAAGYTTELSNFLSVTAAMPYFLCVDDSIDASPIVSTWNKFAMGATTTFEAGFNLSGPLSFDTYLTMGYGHSALKPDRLTPKYYNPEFNRKAAWKVEVTPPEGANPPAMGNTWNDTDTTTPFDVEVTVFDWQYGATVSTEPDFGDAATNEIFAASDPASVSVEIPGMNSTLPQSITPVSGTGTPDDPLIYTVSFPNQNGLAVGEYIGLVKVTDERAPATSLPPASQRDYLIDSPDGIVLNFFVIDEYATYQTFTATVVIGNLMPIADAVATTATTILESMAVSFDATASSDPDGTVVVYEWDFDEDGVFGESPDDNYTGNSWMPTHAFALGDGSIAVQLRVTDNLGGTDELDTPITITVNPSKNIQIRAGINISDLCSIPDTDEVMVMFADNQVWKYANDLSGGAYHHTLPVSGTPLARKIESTDNGDTLNGYWTSSLFNSYSFLYNGSYSAAHTNAWPPYANSYVVTLYTGSYDGYMADLKTVFLNPTNIWLDRYAPPTYPPGSGTFWSYINGPYGVNKDYAKGVHAFYNNQRLAWVEGNPEWRLEITVYGSTGLYTIGGSQTNNDNGFWSPIDITCDSSDDIFILDILSTGVRKIKKFSNTAISLGSFGDNTTMSVAPVCLDASYTSGWIYVGLGDMISIFFPSEQP